MRSRPGRTAEPDPEWALASTSAAKRRARPRRRALLLCAGAAGLCGFGALAARLARGVAVDPARRQAAGAAANAFDGCAWREPRAVVVAAAPRGGAGALGAAIAGLGAATGRYVVERLPPPAKAGDATFASRVDRAAARAADYGGLAVLVGAAPAAVRRGDVAVVGALRDPRRALAAAYAGDAAFPTVGACAANATCARARSLAAGCSAATLTFCGDSCAVDGAGAATADATDAAVANVASLLLVVPRERLDAAGYALLETLLPTYFDGLAARAGGGDADDPERPTVATKRSEWAALAALCAPDQRVYDAASAAFERAVGACAGDATRAPTPFPTLAALAPYDYPEPSDLLAVERTADVVALEAAEADARRQKDEARARRKLKH